MIEKINTMYFSPTGTTEKVVLGIAQNIAQNIARKMMINTHAFTLPGARKEPVSYTAEDLVIIGVPVYAGRVPNVLLKYLNSLQGNGAVAVAVVVYGNRDYEDALLELKDILEADGFQVIAGGAFIGEHSFSKTLAQGRPDLADMAIVADFAQQIYTKVSVRDKIQTVVVKGHKPYIKYYVPKNAEGIAVSITKVSPQTNNNCVQCKLCVNVCPMGSIDAEDVSKITGICIKCGACLKKCPQQAKYYADQNYLRHKLEIETNYATPRREPELFV